MAAPAPKPPTSMTESGRILEAIDGLPTLPVVALQIGEIIHNKNVTVEQVARIMRTDPATSAKLLRLVNSPYFGIPGGVSDVARAIPFIGFNTLYQLVLSIGVLETLSQTKGGDPRALWMHSLTVATAARELATEIKVADAGACFTAGLLHDMGKIAMLQLGELATQLGLGDTSHDKLGSKLARAWRFPATLQTPIEMHHDVHRLEVRDRLAPNLRAITEVVAAADHVASECAAAFGSDLAEEDGDPVRPRFFERNGYTTTQITKLKDRTKTELERSKVFLALVEAPSPAAGPSR